MIDRRGFLKLSAAGAALAASTGCSPGNQTPPNDRAGAPGSQTPGTETPAAGAAALAPFALEEWTVAQLADAMAEGSESARSITQAYLERIEAVDRSGPALRAVIEVNPQALEIADALDRERKEKGARSPLHGIPVVIKDNIDTEDRMATAAGSLALAGTVAPQDSTVAHKLRAAGAIILAKTNLSEWANFRSERSSSGWSGRGGQTRNPFALDRNPCGSSSGSGAAVSANLSALAIGTETDGSVVCPCSANGVVGIKPTVGLISRAGIIPIAHSQDTAGPMCRTVGDAALLLGALTGVDARDPATAASEGHAHSDYTPFLDAGGLRGARIGVWRDRFGFHEKVDTALEAALRAMRDAGAEMIDPVDIPSIGEIGDAEFEVLLYEFKTDLNAYLAARGEDTKPRTLLDLIRFNQAHAAQEMPYFQQEIFEKAQAKGPLTERAYRDALATCRTKSRDQGLDRVLREHRLDAIVAPTGGPAWKTDLINGDHFSGGSSSAAAVSGYASITVPAGFVFGLPIGLSFLGAAWSEPKLLAIAFAFEQATHIRQPPRFLPQADLEA